MTTKYVCWTDDDLWMTATVDAHAPDEAALEYIEELIAAGRATGGETIRVIPLTSDHAYDYEYDDLVTSFGDDGDDLDWGDDADDDVWFEIDFDEFFSDDGDDDGGPTPAERYGPAVPVDFGDGAFPYDDDVDDNEYEGPSGDNIRPDVFTLQDQIDTLHDAVTATLAVVVNLLDKTDDVEPPRRSLWRTFFG